jgi:hypothetical protein
MEAPLGSLFRFLYAKTADLVMLVKDELFAVFGTYYVCWGQDVGAVAFVM